jgi:tyrosinase
MTLQVEARPQGRRATLKVRQNINEMSATQVTRFRKAMKGMMERPDNRGYQFFAGWHWIPLELCIHHEPMFLPWHRGYLYFFELALQEIDPEVTIPWWDWMNEPGIPAAYREKKADGKANVLHSAPIEPVGVKRQPGWPKRTRREPGKPIPGVPAAAPPPLRSFYDWLMEATSYEEFQMRCWRLHDNIHVWVGGPKGQMSDPNWAAFDPLFWAHHAMVDRLWRIWQHRNPGAVPDHSLLREPMTFGKRPSLRVREVLDVKRLGYEYAAQAATVPGAG